MTKQTKDLSNKYWGPDETEKLNEEVGEPIDQTLEQLEEIWQDKEKEADKEAKHMPKEKAYRGTKVK